MSLLELLTVIDFLIIRFGLFFILLSNTDVCQYSETELFLIFIGDLWIPKMNAKK